MKVGHFISLFPSENENVQVYGAGRVAYHLCKKLAEKGHTIQVFVPFRKDLKEGQDNITIHFYRSFLRIGIMHVSYKMFFNPLNYDIDIVHIHNDSPISVIAGLRYAEKKKKSLVVTWHGDWIENYGSVLRRMGVYFCNKFLIPKLLSRGNVIITPSIYYVQESKFLKKYQEKLVEIPNGINLNEFSTPYTKSECRERLGLSKAKNIVLFLGALYQLKGPHILLKAIPKIVKEHKDTVFVFVGGGNVSKYKKLSEDMKIQEHVKFTGYVEEKLKPLYYKAADIFVLPSIETFEVFPIVLLEASASGLPMVVSDLNTFKCIINDGYNGVVIKRGDEKSLANAIIYLLENEDIRKEMGRNAKKKAEKYSWEKIAEMTEEVYRSVY
jgi:glycosyltransferase involved in cell wall biosynthesis